MRAFTLLYGAALTCVAALFTLPALAQSETTAGFSLDRFEPSERGSEWFVLDTLDFRGKLRPAVGVIADYAHKPLVFYDKDGNESQALVENQLFLHFGASLVLYDRVRLAVNLPVAALVQGNPGVIDGQTYSVAEGGQIGDLRMSADVRLFGRYRGLATMTAGLSVWAPTGDPEAYTGDGKVRFAPHVNLAGQVAMFAYAAKVGVNLRLQDSELAGGQLGDEIFGGVSFGLRLAGGNLLIGPELYFSSVLEGDAFSKNGTPFEGIIGAHYCVADVVRLGGGVGPGFTKGYGSPDVRALFSAEWAPCAGDPEDRDKDGILDDVDACPDVPGVRSDDPAKNGCPDRDGDGIFDSEDACPDTPGVRSADPAKNGCPDRDGDGIFDNVDACPDLPGLASSDPTKNGCPDTDGDGIIDPEDACPNAAGPPNEDPKKHGCPAARIEEGQIRILEQVQFKTDSDEILGESDMILDAVKTILVEHPDLTRISVEGHTDNVGTAAYNRDLSTRRAASVVRWLVAHQVDPARLSSAGFGLEWPIADNDTEEGRRANRRVEFHIRELNGQRVDSTGLPLEDAEEVDE